MPTFTGIFQSDSPALFARLKRELALEALGELSELWRLIFHEVGFVDPEIEGGRESEYQARPARICHILVHEIREMRAPMLAAAIILGAPADYRPSVVSPVIEDGLALAREAWNLRAGGAGSMEAERLFGAALLDSARHFHLGPSPSDERRAKVEMLRGQIELVERHPENARLAQLLRKTFDRQRFLAERGS